MSVHNGRSLTRSEHRRHDRLLVTRFAMDDAYSSERDEAIKLIETCSDCASLAADVRVIAMAMPRLAVAPRTRDFTITHEQAERLRGSGLSRWLRTLAMPGWGALRPVAGVALSIGLVMAVVGAGVPGMQPASESSTDRTNPGASPAAVPAAQATQEPMVPEVGTDSGVESGPPGEQGPLVDDSARGTEDPASRTLDTAYVAASPEPDLDSKRAELTQSVATDPSRDLLVYGGLIIATLSLAVLALAWVARRYFADPFLR